MNEWFTSFPNDGGIMSQMSFSNIDDIPSEPAEGERNVSP